MTCSTCQDLGYVYNGSAEVRRGQHGRLELCRCIQDQCRCGGGGRFYWFGDDGTRHQCACYLPSLRMQAVGRLVQDSSIPERFRWTFRDAWEPAGAPIVRAVAKLVESEEMPTQGLFLHGPPGTGKTMLGCILLNELMLRRRRPARFVNLTRQLFPWLRDTFSEESRRHGQALQILEELQRVPYLVIDDIGVERGTEWEEEILYALVDGRYADQRFTVVTTNVPDVEEIRAISRGRVHSRLQEMCRWVELTGPDRREAVA